MYNKVPGYSFAISDCVNGQGSSYNMDYHIGYNRTWHF